MLLMLKYPMHCYFNIFGFKRYLNGTLFITRYACLFLFSINYAFVAHDAILIEIQCRNIQELSVAAAVITVDLKVSECYHCYYLLLLDIYWYKIQSVRTLNDYQYTFYKHSWRFKTILWGFCEIVPKKSAAWATFPIVCCISLFC